MEDFLIVCVGRGTCVYYMYIPGLGVGKALCKSEGGRVEGDAVRASVGVMYGYVYAMLQGYCAPLLNQNL